MRHRSSLKILVGARAIGGSGKGGYGQSGIEAEAILALDGVRSVGDAATSRRTTRTVRPDCQYYLYLTGSEMAAGLGILTQSARPQLSLTPTWSVQYRNTPPIRMACGIALTVCGAVSGTPEELDARRSSFIASKRPAELLDALLCARAGQEPQAG